jgi:hypothetical protein
LGLKVREASKIVAMQLGLPVNEVYRAVLDRDKSGE